MEDNKTTDKQEKESSTRLVRERELCDLVLGEVDEYVRLTSTERILWKKFYDQYLSITTDKNESWMNNCFIPKTHQAVEGMFAYILANDPTLLVEPEGTGDSYLKDLEKAEKQSKLLNFVWRKVLNMGKKIDPWGKQLCLFGTGIMKIFWKTDYFKEKAGEEMQMRITYDDAYGECVNIFDFYTDPYSPIGFGKSDIQRIEYPKNKLLAMGYDVVKDMKPGIGDSSSQNMGQYSSSRALDSQDPNLDQGRTKSDSYLIEVFERWGTLPIRLLKSLEVNIEGFNNLLLSDDDEVETVTTIGRSSSGSRCLKVIVNPYEGRRPFFPGYFRKNPLPNRAYGLGIGHVGSPIQNAITNITNMILDNMVIANNPPHLRRRGSRVDPRQLVYRPGGFIDVDTVQDVQQMQIQDVRQSAYQLRNSLDLEYQLTTAMTNSQKGMSGGSESATEASIVASSAGVLIDRVRKNVEESLSEMSSFIKYLYSKNMDRAKSVIVLDPVSRGTLSELITPEDLSIDSHTYVKSDSTTQINKAVLMKIIGDGAKIFQGIVDPYEAARLYFDIPGVSEGNRLIKKPSPQPEQQVMPPDNTQVHTQDTGTMLNEGEMLKSVTQNAINPQ